MEAVEATRPIRTPDPQPLTLSAPQVGPGIHEATLSWSTSLPTTALVEYGAGESTTLQDITLQPAQSDHLLTLSGLTANSVYRFRITVTADDGRSLVSDFQEFSTLEEPSVDFGIRLRRLLRQQLGRRSLDVHRSLGAARNCACWRETRAKAPWNCRSPPG